MSDLSLIREWNVDKIEYSSHSDPAPKASPSIGLVIGSYAAIPYIHLQLESRRRFYPHIPCLIHNDGTETLAELKDLARIYNADLEYNSVRMDHTIGDLTAFIGGLLWAKKRSLDLLLKVSRRWIFVRDWQSSLTQLALESQYHTFSNCCTDSHFGFRSECLAMLVSTWASERFFVNAFRKVREGTPVFMESYMHQFALIFEGENTEAAENWRRKQSVDSWRAGYAAWAAMGTNRHAPVTDCLWHEFSNFQEYASYSRKWGLPYSLEEFRNPNQF